MGLYSTRRPHTTTSSRIRAFRNRYDTTDDLATLIQSAWTAGGFEESCQKAQEAEKKLETVLGAKTQMTAKDTFDELLLCRLDKNKRWGKPIVHARKDRLRDRISGKKGVRAFRRSGEYEKRELAEFMAPDSQKEPNKANPLNAVKANFWKKEAGGTVSGRLRLVIRTATKTLWPITTFSALRPKHNCFGLRPGRVSVRM